MVTTINITCDGVFIHSSSSALTDETAESSTENEESKRISETNEERTQPKIALPLKNNNHDTGKRYYFGNNTIYWCKETLDALNTSQRRFSAARKSNVCSILRSASSVSQKLQKSTNGNDRVVSLNNAASSQPEKTCNRNLNEHLKIPKHNQTLKTNRNPKKLMREIDSLEKTCTLNFKNSSSDERFCRLLRPDRSFQGDSNESGKKFTNQKVEHRSALPSLCLHCDLNRMINKRLSMPILTKAYHLTSDQVLHADDDVWFDKKALRNKKQLQNKLPSDNKSKKKLGVIIDVPNTKASSLSTCSTTVTAKQNFYSSSAGDINKKFALSVACGEEKSNTGTVLTATDMNSHATATQALHNLQNSGQASVVGHHRGFSQPSVTVAANSSGDPWFLQSTGHQMPPTAPLRHNKRPAPQPTVAGAVGGSATITDGLLHQQLSQSQPLIVPPNIPPHQNNVNSHINAIHLSSHALNSHNIIASNNSPKSPNQQQLPTPTGGAVIAQPQQQPQQHALAHIHGGLNSHTHTAGSNIAAAAVAAVTQQQQQQHMQLLSNTCNNNSLMSSSLNAAQLQGHMSLAVGGSIGSGAVVPITLGLDRGLPQKTGLGGLHGSNVLLHTAIQPASLSTALSAPQSLSSSGMSTSLHSFDINGCSTSAWTSTASSMSPTTAQAPIHGATGMIQQLQLPQRKCEVKLNAMPWFHGSITRDEAEHLLQPREDGLFLVRESTNFPGDYTLCVCFQGKVEHYRVKYLENKLTIDDEEYFENLGQLVAHYEADADGLCTQLIKCLPKKGKQEFCINSKDFVDKGWVIPESDLQLRESIGKGEFGDVLLGILRNEKVAVKMLKDEGAVQKFLAEASVMTTLEHENLVKFIGLVFTRKHIYLVTEYMSKGSLVDYLRSRGRQHITKKDQINFAYDTASGMEYLEAKKVVHRDLAARNVLISETCVAKVSDFGLAREECYNLDVGKLPIKWTAPEALKNGRFSNKSDIWSFGILLWEIYSFGRVPYPRIPLADVVKHVEVGYKMEAPEGCPPEIYEMMRQTWDLNPSKRPTFSELKVKLLHLKNITT